MYTILERAAHSVDRMFFLYFDYLSFSYFPFVLLWRDLGSDCFSSWSLLTCYFQQNRKATVCGLHKALCNQSRNVFPILLERST